MFGSITLLQRLSINITPPADEKVTWVGFFIFKCAGPLLIYIIQWPTRTSGVYFNIKLKLDSLVTKLEGYRLANMICTNPYPDFFEQCSILLKDELGFLFAIATLRECEPDVFQAQLDEEFCLGPNGFGPVIHFFYSLHCLLISFFEKEKVTVSDAEKCIETMNTVTAPLLSLLQHFRSSMPCARYDPPGFSALSDALSRSRKLFGVYNFSLL